MPTFPHDDPLSTPQNLTAAPDRHFWQDGLGFGGFQGVLSLGAGFDDEWKRAFGAGENKSMADAILGRHGDSVNVRRNLLLAARYAEKTDVEAVCDVLRSIAGDRNLPDENKRRYCRNGLAARIVATKPHALLGARALDDFSPRRHFALTLDGRKVAPPGPLHTLDWNDITARALVAMGKARGSLLLRAIVVRKWREDVFLAFREQGRASPNWKPDDPYVLQLGHKQEWRWVRLLDGAHRAQVAGLDAERSVEIASAVASAIWEQPRVYDWSRDPLTPERLQTFHEAVINPHEDKLKLLEIVAEQPGFYMRPIVKVGNTGQLRVERVLDDYWSAGIGFARDPGHVVRVKLAFQQNRRKYRIEVYYPEDPLADEPTLGFGTSGVHPDMADAFVELVLNEFGVFLNPRSPADANARSTAWSEKPSPLRPRHWERMLAPTLLRPSPWEKREIAPHLTSKLVQVHRHAVFRCGSPAILGRRPHGAGESCTGWVVGEIDSVSPEEPFLQQPGEPFPCELCGALWPRQAARLPWQERWAVTVDPAAAWKLVGELLSKRVPAGQRPERGVLGWYDGEPHEVIGVDVTDDTRRAVARGAGRRVAWFAASSTLLGPYGDRGVSLAEVLADGVEAFDRAFALGVLPGAPGTVYLAKGPPPLYDSGGPRIGSRDHKGIVQRGDDGAYLHQRRVVDGRQRVLMLTLAALQRATDDEGAQDDDRGWHRAEDLAEIVNDELKTIKADSKLQINARRVNTWVQRLRDSITDAHVPAVTGLDVIEDGNQKGLRLGRRFRLDGFDVRHETLAYSMNPPPTKRSSEA